MVSHFQLDGLEQNNRGGDCGAICVKFFELHSHALQDQLIALTNAQIIIFVVTTPLPYTKSWLQSFSPHYIRHVIYPLTYFFI